MSFVLQSLAMGSALSRHRSASILGIALILSAVDIIVSLSTSRNFRISPLLRPIVFVSRSYAIRQEVRSIMKTLPDVLEVHISL
jgi:Mg2+/Co2+ transporter CorC